MKFPRARIIAVDDDERDLNAIVTALQGIGVSCLPVLYRSSENLVTVSGIRIVFMDINLLPGPMSEASNQAYAIIVSLLQKLLGPDNGPYALVAWTSRPGRYDEMMKFIEDRLTGAPKPFASVALEKERFFRDGVVQDPGELVKAIEEAVHASPAFAALLDWEERVLDAAHQTVRSVLSLVPPAEQTAAGMTGSVQRILTSIAQAAVGLRHVSVDRTAAVNEALSPVLSDRLSNLPPSDARVWENAIPEPDKVVLLDAEAAGAINSALHLEFKDGLTAADRGAAIRVPEANLTDLAKLIGGNLAEFVEQQFLSLDRVYDDTGLEISVKADKKTRRGTIAGACHWVLVEGSAGCDYAQKRRRLPQYIIALEVPERYRRYIEHSQDGFRMRTRHEALVPSPIFRIEDATVILMFHLRMVLSPLPEWAKLTPAFRLRGQLLDQVIQRLSFHEARLGIVELASAEVSAEEVKPGAEVGAARAEARPSILAAVPRVEKGDEKSVAPEKNAGDGADKIKGGS